MWAWLKKCINHERYETIAVLVCVCMLIWFYGCESQVYSIRDPLIKVTRPELQIEIDTILALAEMRLLELDQQDELKRVLLEKSLLIAQGGVINPVGVITAIAAVLGIGATVDNIRKRKEIKKITNNA